MLLVSVETGQPEESVSQAYRVLLEMLVKFRMKPAHCNVCFVISKPDKELLQTRNCGLNVLWELGLRSLEELLTGVSVSHMAHDGL